MEKNCLKAGVNLEDGMGLSNNFSLSKQC